MLAPDLKVPLAIIIPKHGLPAPGAKAPPSTEAFGEIGAALGSAMTGDQTKQGNELAPILEVSRRSPKLGKQQVAPPMTELSFAIGIAA